MAIEVKDYFELNCPTQATLDEVSKEEMEIPAYKRFIEADLAPGQLVGPADAHLPSSAHTAVAWTPRSWASSSPMGAGMFSDVVTARLPSAVAAANWT